MSPEIESYPRPTDPEISQTADRLSKIDDVTPETWMRRLEMLSKRKEGSLQLPLHDWMERMLEYGTFAGWEAADLRKLKELISSARASVASTTIRN
jgi:hypothetical protein